MSSENRCVDDSLLNTPKPTATSTITKNEKYKNVDRKHLQIPLNLSSTSEANISSLGVLNGEDIEISTDHTSGSDVMNRLRTQRMLAQSLIDKVSKSAGLPSKYFKADSMLQKTNRSDYPDNSTVNESDLFNRKESVNSQTFYPNDVSTPRTSDAPEKPLESSMFESITEMSQKIRTSDISLHDICLELHKVSQGRFSTSTASGVDSQMFTPAELMSEKLLKDEMSWRREKDVPFDKLRDSIVSAAGSEKPSMGDFFQARYNDLGDMFKMKSPERLYPPIPLIDVTNVSNVGYNIPPDMSKIMVQEADNSVMSVTQIAKALAELTCDTPLRCVDRLLKNGKPEKANQRSSSSEKKSVSPHNENYAPRSSNLKSSKENDCDDYIAKNQLHDRSKSSIEFNRQVSVIGVEIKGGPNRDSRRSSSCYDQFGEVAIEAQSSMASSDSTTFAKSPESRDDSKLRYERTSGISSLSSRENKENMFEYPSLGSRCPSSIDSIPEDKLPIKGNKLEIVWGCLKLGRSNTQSCCIRNQLNQRIRMQVSVTGSGFRIVKERGDTEMLTSMIFILHPLETKALSIMFYPMSIGAFYEKLNFHPISNGEIVKNSRQTIKLCGYGGHASVEMTKLAKDSTGKLWLSLGSLEHKSVISQQFTIKNTGVLSGFAMMQLSNDYISNIDKVSISPKELVIRSQEEITITLTYSPSRQDFRSQQEIIDVGSIKIITGAEVLRGRLRRLCTMIAHRNEPVDPFMTKISKKLPEEDIPADLSTLTESTAIVKELLQQLIIKEIRLTIERDLDSTLVGSMTNFEDTTMYQTLYQDCTMFPEGNDVKKKTTSGQFRVEPNSIFFSLPYKRQDTILLHSNCPTSMTYEVEATNGFTVTPSSGAISSGDTIVIRITCTEMPSNGSGKVSVYVENEVMDVNLKAVFINKKIALI